MGFAKNFIYYRRRSEDLKAAIDQTDFDFFYRTFVSR